MVSSKHRTRIRLSFKIIERRITAVATANRVQSLSLSCGWLTIAVQIKLYTIQIVFGFATDGCGRQWHDVCQCVRGSRLRRRGIVLIGGLEQDRGSVTDNYGSKGGTEEEEEDWPIDYWQSLSIRLSAEEWLTPLLFLLARRKKWQWFAIRPNRFLQTVCGQPYWTDGKYVRSFSAKAKTLTSVPYRPR